MRFLVVALVFALLNHGNCTMNQQTEDDGLETTILVTKEAASSSTTATPSLEQCHVDEGRAYKVRIQEIDNGQFVRRAVSGPLYNAIKATDHQTLSNANDINECYSEVINAGYNSFTWDEDECTAYAAWVPDSNACQYAGAYGIYMADSMNRPFTAPDPIVADLQVAYKPGTINTVILSWTFHNFFSETPPPPPAVKIVASFRTQELFSEVVTGTSYEAANLTVCRNPTFSVQTDGSDEEPIELIVEVPEIWSFHGDDCKFVVATEDSPATSYDEARDMCTAIGASLIHHSNIFGQYKNDPEFFIDQGVPASYVSTLLDAPDPSRGNCIIMKLSQFVDALELFSAGCDLSMGVACTAIRKY